MKRFTIYPFRGESYTIYSDKDLVEEFRRCAQKGERTFGDGTIACSVDMTVAVVDWKANINNGTKIN